MSDRYVETTSTSWLQRIQSSLVGLLVGLVFFVGAFPLLWWNEGRAVTTARSLAEGAASVVAVSAEPLDSANDGRLVHVSGKVTTASPRRDPLFGVTAPVLKLRRTVEMYQWTETSHSETRDKLGGGSETVTTYTYEKRWSEKYVSSGDFKQPSGHANPPQMRFTSESWLADDAKLGAYAITPRLVGRLDDGRTMPILASDVTTTVTPAPMIRDGGLYFGENPDAPAIGDVRIAYHALFPTDASFVARQSGSSLEPYQTRAGDAIELVDMGRVGADAMFKAAETENAIVTWILRAVGFVVMIIGVALALGPLVAIGKVVPFIGSIIGVGTGLVALLVAAPLSLVTIALAWLAYRPLIGGALLVAAVALVFGLRALGKRKAAAQAGATPAAA